MDVKELKQFESWFSQEFRCDEWEYNPFSRMEFNDIDAYSCSTVNTAWLAWQAAKGQAIPKGFVVVPKEPTNAMLKASWDNLDAGSGDEFWNAYCAVIEAAQGSAND